MIGKFLRRLVGLVESFNLSMDWNVELENLIRIKKSYLLFTKNKNHFSIENQIRKLYLILNSFWKYL